MFPTMIPLHMGHPVGGLFMLLPGLLLTLILGVIAFRLLRHGRFGPVRWAPHHEGSQPGRPGPGFGPGPFGGGRPPWAQPSPEEAALATLAERLAKGEISPEEYLERAAVLRNSRPPQ